MLNTRERTDEQWAAAAGTDSSRRRSLRTPGVIAAALVGLLVGAFAGGPALLGASAAPVATVSQAAATGWVRLAHLSPDTSKVDIQLTALAGGSVVSSLQNIGYGQVSNYMSLPQGAYIVSMAPAGGDMSAPVIQATIAVADGRPVTVAAYGKNASLSTAVFPDDLTAPAEGESRVRVIQGSTALPSVTVSTSTGTVLASDVAPGTATPYSNVSPGPSTLTVSGGTTTSSTQVDLPVGAISTLFVLDNASGGVTVTSVADASSVAALPTGGIQTGGGGTGAHVNSELATAESVGGLSTVVVVALVVAALVVSALVVSASVVGGARRRVQ
ncbi:hypothetical protein C5B96_06300 [Subtercola sp. Z020]|uniref:DUF4397 domain-containing protein n=1 Tax=Subtercola sp. Z020 TaxID=2080582 RepID=UPI000CE82D76|nr:DUF4397 domain-containing protein [Subtercola sp. Z020]PPF85670.1 hypothetical protein C5B96_06300 [Subtercola sp. Z020]